MPKKAGMEKWKKKRGVNYECSRNIKKIFWI